MTKTIMPISAEYDPFNKDFSLIIREAQWGEFIEILSAGYKQRGIDLQVVVFAYDPADDPILTPEDQDMLVTKLNAAMKRKKISLPQFEHGPEESADDIADRLLQESNERNSGGA